MPQPMSSASPNLPPQPWVTATLEGRAPAPVVLLLGGFITSPPLYRGLVDSLREHGAADVVVAPVWTPDWIMAAWRGLGPIVGRSSKALDRAVARSSQVAGSAPILVIGHSAGGMSARLLTAQGPFEGRHFDRGGQIGAIVTLGTPHLVNPPATFRNRVSGATARFANRELPGAWLAPTTGYLAVAGRSEVGRTSGTPAELRRLAQYRELLGEPEADDVEGDGLIPMRSAILPGVRAMAFDDCVHAWQGGRDWYGSERFLAQWWPVAVETWQGALQARAFDGSADLR